MLSLFPYLLDYSFFAPTLLRVAIALLILVGSTRSFKQRKVVALSVIKISASILLLIGLLTQLAALVLVLAIVFEIWQAKKRGDGHFHLHYHLLKLAVLVALLLLGPGAWAFDWPL
ncbi:MAG: hypothetical protein HYV76_02835 [Candidatus Vogelbacteria bacterium]|nr:hypothetical protein [Candidatus Vogelbacteria bacterium]